MLGDLLIGVNANDKLLTEGFGLTQRIRMSKVHHIIAI